MTVDRTNWAQNPDETLWAYQISSKTSIGMSSYQLVFCKAFHLPVDLDHKALWVLKKLNLSRSDMANLMLK